MFALAMIVAAVWAAVVLPAGARIPLHFGSVERCYLVPKPAASSLAADWVPGVRYVLAPAATGVLLAFEAGALAMARRAGVSPAAPEGARERETSARSG